MRKQRSPCTFSSYGNLSDWQVSSSENCSNENQLSYPDSYCSQLLPLESNPDFNLYQDIFPVPVDYNGEPAAQNLYFQNYEEAQENGNEQYLAYDSLNPAEPFPIFQEYIDESYNFPAENEVPSYEDPFHPTVLQCGMPAVTDYGAVTILLRHLIRVDLTFNGSVSIYNFPAMSVTTLNAAGNKCYVQHPNGRVYQDGSVVHMVTGNNRFIKFSQKGITFSPALQSLAYLVDESGTKTSTAKFTDLSRDLTMDLFYDGNRRSYAELENECYRMVLESTYQKLSDNSELWLIGRIRIKQDRWGEVTVSQNNGRRTIMASPTIRRVTVDSASVNINIDCYSKNYFSVRKDTSSVTSGFCGLIVRNRSQKAGLDRTGRLVLF